MSDGPRILIAVEDDEDMRYLISVVLSADSRLDISAGTGNAVEAVEIARSCQPDLIILDHFIEGSIMGLQAAPMLKDVSPGSKILLFTTHDLAVEASRENAIDGFLRKSNISELLSVVHDMLGLNPNLVNV